MFQYQVDPDLRANWLTYFPPPDFNPLLAFQRAHARSSIVILHKTIGALHRYLSKSTILLKDVEDVALRNLFREQIACEFVSTLWTLL